MSNVRAGNQPQALKDQKPDLIRNFTTAVEDPAEMYAELRAKSPLALQQSDTGSAWLITRYQDIVDAAKKPAIFGQSIRFHERPRPPLESNPPEHRHWRALLAPYFIPKAIARLEPITNDIASELIAPLVASGGGDFAHEVARPLPPQVLLSWMNQSRQDWEKVKNWSEAAYYQSSSDPAQQKLFAESDKNMWKYSENAVRARIEDSHDITIDPIAGMVAAISEEGPITEALIIGVVRLLLGAGHDSTTSAVGICIQFIAERPDLQATLRSEPKHIPSAIEEILRLRAPVLQMPRTLMQDVDLCDRRLCEGDAALLVYASGNLDEDAFPDASQFKLGRKPNRHLSFGTGIHTCIGNILARQEIRVILEQLLVRTKDFRLSRSADHEFWHPYGTTNLNLTVDPAG